MNALVEKFQEIPAQKMEAGRITLLPEGDTAWLVKKGSLDLYLVKNVDSADQPAGRLNYIASVGENGIFFGSGGGGTYKTVYRAVSDTELVPADKKTFLEVSNREEFREDAVKMVSGWLECLRKAADLPAVGQEPHDEAAASKETPGDLSAVYKYTGVLFDLCVEKLEKELENEREHYTRKVEKENSYVENAIRNLASITKSSKENAAPVKALLNPLVEACRLVGDKLAISIAPVPEEILQRSGNPMEDIARASKIRCRRINLEGEWWREDCGPLVGYLGNGDPVALLPVSARAYVIHNPSEGTAVKADQSSASLLKGYAYMLYPSLPVKKLDVKDLLKFMGARAPKKDLAAMLLMGILGGLLGVLNPVVNGMVFDTVIPEGQKGQLLQVVILLFSVSASILLFQLVRAFAMLRIESKLDTSVQAAVWDRLLSLPAPFFRNYTVGELANRAMGINQIRKKLSGMAVNTVLSSIFSIFSLILLFSYSVRIALFAVLLTVLSMAVTLAAGWIQLKSESELLEITNKISGQVLQFLGGIAKLRTAGAENRAFYQWSKSYAGQNRLYFRKQSIENVLTTFNASFSVLNMMVIFFLVAADSGMSMGGFIAFNSAYIGFQTGFLALSAVILEINIIVPMYKNTKPILEALPEYDETRIDPGDLDGSIEVRHVTFRYNKDAPAVLNDISLKINAGEYVAVVGTSGCGKSTLLRLLLGFEKPETGRIYFSGHDLESIDIRSVRRQLGVVLQNGRLLSGDIFTNIVGSSSTLTINDAWDAARMSGLEEDIKRMPMGMHTVISEGASTISGGQKQRIMIARAIVKKPKILFFDEATSALDNRTQAIVSQSLDRLKSTRVVIAHRLSTVMKCDRIIVMNKGTIAEEGSYNELMELKGLFYQLAKRQLA